MLHGWSKSFRSGHRRGELLPDDVGLNINYPLVEGGDDPSGIELTVTGRGFIDVTYNNGALPAVGQTASYAIQVDSSAAETVRDVDSSALAENKISITPIEGDYDAQRSANESVRRIIQHLD